MPAPVRNKTQVPPLPPLPRRLIWLYRVLDWWCRHVETSPLMRLRLIYRYVNAYNRFISRHAVCRKRCSACCHDPVAITDTEAALIAIETGRNCSTRCIPVARPPSPCPFLGKGGVCTIYHVRPFNCRTLHAMDDPKYCETGEEHVVHGSPSDDYGSPILASLARMIQSDNRSGNRRDIRDYFS